jgi:AcrR family transcriptional regulator
MMASDDEIPRSLQLLWGRAQPPRRGPRPALRLRRIVAAAVQIADAEGIHALSMARLAQKLGCAPMSLYRHVASKEELQVFMMDTAPGKPPRIDLPARHWRRGLERWARELRAVYYRHPWILQITTGRPPLEPGQLAWLDCGLRTLRGSGLGAARKMSVILLVVHYVRGAVQINAVMLEDLKRSDKDNRKRQDWYGRTLARLVDAKRFPAVAELISAGVFDSGGKDVQGSDDFDFGLARILDGIETLVGARPTRAAPAGGRSPRG